MLRFALGKLVRALLTLWLVVTFTFVVLRATGDPVLSLLPDNLPEAIYQEYRVRWGVDKPIWRQYLVYLQGIADGTLGHSFTNGREATAVVAERVPKTLLLTGLSFLLVLLIGVPAGVAAALHRDSGVDRAVMAAAVAGYSLPNFLLGLLLIYAFAVGLQILPSSGSSTWQHLVLPVVTLGTSAAAIVARFTRAAVLDVLEQPFMRAAYAGGLLRSAAIRRHALPNAAIPVVTVLGFSVGGLIGGSIITESVFAWPGIGRLLADAVAARDLAVVQAIVLLLAAAMVAANLLVDLSYGLLNPRIRLVGHGR